MFFEQRIEFYNTFAEFNKQLDEFYKTFVRIDSMFTIEPRMFNKVRRL